MALNFDKNKIENTGTNVVSSPSVAPTLEPSTTPKPNVEFDGQYYKPEKKSTAQNQGQDENVSETRTKRATANENAVDEMAHIKAAALEAEEAGISRIKLVSEDNTKEIKNIEKTDIETKNQQQAEHIKKSHKVLEYGEIISKNDKSIYQKTSVILDEYMKNHPEEYPQYANMNDEDKRKFRDAQMGDLFRKLVGKKNISQTERKIATRDLSILLMTAESQGLSLKELSSNPEKMKSLISQGDKQLYDFMLSKIDTSNPSKALNEIAELYLTFTDSKYLLLEGAEKNKYLQNKQSQIFNIIGVKDPNKLSDDIKQNSANIMVSLLQNLSDKDKTIKDLVEMPPHKQAEFIIYSLDDYQKKHPEIKDSLPPETKHAYEMLKTRAALLQEIKKDRPSEEDVYQLLLKKEKDGKLNELEIQMLDAYKLQDRYDKKTGKHTLRQEANLSSNVVKRLATGMSYEAMLKHQLDGVKDKNEVQKIVTEYLSGAENDSDRHIQLHSLRKVLLEKGFKDEDIKNMLPKDLQERLTVKVLANPDAKQAASGTDIMASFGSEVIDETANAVNEILPSVRDSSWLKFYGSNVETTKYDEALSKGINKLDIATANDIFTHIANNASTDAKKSSIVKFSLTTTNDEKRVSSYTDSYKTIKSPAVTEGMAAAANIATNSNIKSIINSGVDYAISNNGYSSEEIKNINTARETGQTSYERNAASTNNSASNSNSTYKSNDSQNLNNNTVANSINNSQTSGAPATSFANSAKVVVSAQTQSKLNEMRNNIAQLQYNHSVESRNKALDSIERIITHIQEDKQVRAQKQAEQKEALEKKAEIAKVLEEVATQAAKGESVKAASAVVEDIIAKAQSDNITDIPVDVINKLRNAAKASDLSAIYSILGSVNSRAQESFILRISRKSESVLAGFIKNHSTDKSIIKMLIRLNPNLIKSIDSNLLLNCGIEKSEIIKYADATQLKTILADLSKVGNKEQLKEFYEALGDDAQNLAVEAAPALGSDEWLKQRRESMSGASYSNVVGNSRFSDGQTRQKIRPQDIDYREFLA